MTYEVEEKERVSVSCNPEKSLSDLEVGRRADRKKFGGALDQAEKKSLENRHATQTQVIENFEKWAIDGIRTRDIWNHNPAL